MSYKNITLTLQDSVGIVKINRPDALNALNTPTLDELIEVQKELSSDTVIKVVIITGAGKKAFVSGGDIREMLQLDAINGLTFSNKGHLVLSNFENMRKPVIAAVNGYALGGGLELALACDIIYASDTARLGFPEVTLGIVPGFGGTQRTARQVGLARAKELIFTGKIITALEAYEMGLINKVVPGDELMTNVLQLAEQIAAAGPVAVALAKDCVSGSESFDINSGLEYEAKAFALCCGTDDKNEAMTAFLERRTARFCGQ